MADRDPSDRRREMLPDDPMRINTSMGPFVLQQLQSWLGVITPGYQNDWLTKSTDYLSTQCIAH